MRKEVNQTSIACTRLNTDQIRKLDLKASEKGLSRSVLVKHILLSYLDKETEHTNIIESALITVMEKLDRNSQKQELFQQLFFCFLSNWFLQHPKLEEKNIDVLAKSAAERRDAFVKGFISNFYNESGDLFDMLLASSNEKETE